ncbi:hypothetical protein DMUE_1356 [Dictyocoela muelleri]|nr:hypothetical protein DMUE_1356 [Dictyocoela muelleri]
MKKCYYCHKEEKIENKIIRPCYCIGEDRYIHRICFIKNNYYKKRCEICGHIYQIEFREINFRKLCKIFHLAYKYILLGIGMLFIFLFTCLFIMLYGISVLYLVMGKEYFEENKFIVICSSPLIFILIITGRFIGYHYSLHILPIKLFLDLSNTKHFLISFIPFMFLITRGCIMKKLRDSEMSKCNGEEIELSNSIGLYDHMNDLYGGFQIDDITIPIGKIVVSLLTPYISCLIGLLFEADPLLRSVYGCIFYFLLKQCLYYCYIKLLKKTIRNINIIEPDYKTK